MPSRGNNYLPVPSAPPSPNLSSIRPRPPPNGSGLKQINNVQPYEPHQMPKINDAVRTYFEHAIIGAPGTENFDMEAAQSFVLFHLQTMIVEATLDLIESDTDARLAEMTKYLTARMHEYCNAVRDTEYMKQWAEQKHYRGHDNPFQLRPSRHLERLILVKRRVTNDLPWPAIDRNRPGGPLLPGKDLSRKRDLDSLNWWQRILVALATAACIVMPVFAITYVNVRLYNLLIACGFMALVAVITLSATSVFRTRDALGVTAAYISVLVLFVGAKIKI